MDRIRNFFRVAVVAAVVTMGFGTPALAQAAPDSVAGAASAYHGGGAGWQ
ncbi:hypothetical protein [Nocardiopsis sp. CNT312]|nr:hypothetical protein [Nocardiopsis sp. CNT312]